MSAKKTWRRAKSHRTPLKQVMENCAILGVDAAWKGAWRAAQGDELRNVLLQNFLREFVTAMRSEVEKRARQLGLEVKS